MARIKGWVVVIVLGVLLLTLGAGAMPRAVAVDDATGALSTLLSLDALPRLQAANDSAWTVQEPYDLTGPMPSEKRVREAIKVAVDYLLKSQNDRGYWDEVMAGSMLSGTADQAVDAVAMTALCGLALRTHVQVDPERIEPALVKASAFVCDQIKRGKLSTAVWYAVWRYAWGLKFLAGEYKHTQNEEFKAEIREVGKRMITSLMEMQLMKSGQAIVARAMEPVFKIENPEAHHPAQLGISVKGDGAAIIEDIAPGRAGEKGGLQVGDRIVEVEGVAVTSLYDYYTQEIEFMGGQEVRMKIERAGKPMELSIYIEPYWPGSFGWNLKSKILSVDEGEDKTPETPEEPNKEGGEEGGSEAPKEDKAADEKAKPDEAAAEGKAEETPAAKPEEKPEDDDTEIVREISIQSFAQLSAAQRYGLQIGDILFEVDGVAVESKTQLQKLEKEMMSGQEVTIAVLRGEKRERLEFKIPAGPKPRGSLLVMPAEEDSGETDGVLIQGPQPNSPVASLGLAANDRIMAIDFQPIMGRDHFGRLERTFWKGQSVTVSYQKAGQTEIKTAKIAMGEGRVPSTLGVEYHDKKELPNIASLVKDGPAERGGLKVGDTILGISGVAVRSVAELEQALAQQFQAGQEVKVSVLRATGREEIPVVLGEKTNLFVAAEEGGWAYYPEMGIAPSFATAAALIALMDARQILGLDVPEKSLRAAFNMIASLRTKDPKNSQIEGYAYHQGAIRGQGAYINGQMGRVSACELALVRASDMGIAPSDTQKRTQQHLEKILSTWLDYRYELDRVRDYPMTHYTPLFQNAAYYWLFGHYHSILAANYLAENKELAHRVGVTCLKAVMKDREEDGTWYGHHAFGKIEGTAMGLMILGELNNMFAPFVRDVNVFLQDQVEQIKSGRYGEAFAFCQKLAETSAAECPEEVRAVILEDANYLSDLITKELKDKYKEAKNTFRLDPEDAIERLEAMVESFQGVPRLDQVVKLLEEFRMKDEVQLYRVLKQDYQKVVDEINKAGTRVKEEQVDRFIEELERLCKLGGDYEVVNWSKARIKSLRALKPLLRGPGFLGVTWNPQFNSGGVQVVNVIPGSGAAIAGIQSGDILTKFDGKELKNANTLQAELQRFHPGDEIEMEIKRGTAEPFVVKVVLGFPQ